MPLILNDNTPPNKPQFHPFARWCAVTIDGDAMGYISHFEEKTTLHLKKDAPAWLRDVRSQGPWESNSACQNAIKAAVPVVML